MAMSRQLQFDLRPSPVVLRLIIANVALWLLMLLLGANVEQYFVRPYLMVSSDGVVSHFHVWQPFTYMWLHDTAGVSHILFNMVGLFFLGPPLERRWGQRTFLKFYLLTGIIAGFFSVLVGLFMPSFDVPTLGASGSLLGLLAAWSMVLPNTQILLFFVLPIRTRYIVWIAIALDLVMFFSSSADSTRIGVHTHIGGALAGWLLITGNWRPRVAWYRLNQLFNRGGGGPKPPSAGKRTNLRVIRGGRDDNGRKDDDLLH